jgi:hypothetical protein
MGAGRPPLAAGGAGAHIPQEFNQAARQCWLGGPEPPDLGGAAPQVLGEVRQWDRHPQDPLLVAAQLVAQPAAGQDTQQDRQMVDGLDGGVGVVDGRGQRLVGDVDQPA